MIAVFLGFNVVGKLLCYSGIVHVHPTERVHVFIRISGTHAEVTKLLIACRHREFIAETRQILDFVGNICGKTAKTIRPTNMINGVTVTVFCMLKCFVKIVKIKSINSCVKKLMTTKNPSKVYDKLYSSLKVKNSSGDKLADTDIENAPK